MSKLRQALLASTIAFSPLAACGGDQFTSAAGPLDGAPPPTDGATADGGGEGGTVQNVSGRVVDARGIPIHSVTVVIGGTSVTPGPDGKFNVPRVSTPYDASVISTHANHRAYVFVHLTRNDPTLQLVADSDAAPESSSVSGTAVFAVGANDGSAFLEMQRDTIPVGPQSANMSPGPGTYSLPTQWIGGPATNATLYALEYAVDASSGLPTAYQGFSSTPIVLTGGGVSGQPLAPSGGVSAGHVTATVDFPQGYVRTATQVFFRPVTGARIATPIAVDRAGVGQYMTPVVPGASVVVCATSAFAQLTAETSSACQAAVDPQAGSANLTLVVAPRPSSPSDGATVTAVGTSFTFSTFAGGIHVVTLKASNQPELRIVTGDAQATIPDLSGAGFTLPTSVAYSWDVAGIGPFTSTDDAAGPGGFLSAVVALLDSSGPQSDAAIGTSPSRTVTFK
jgi:hypothetical protein